MLHRYCWQHWKHLLVGCARGLLLGHLCGDLQYCLMWNFNSSPVFACHAVLQVSGTAVVAPQYSALRSLWDGQPPDCLLLLLLAVWLVVGVVLSDNKYFVRHFL